MERALTNLYHSSSRTSLNQSESSQARAWQLHFVDKLPPTLFTGSRIESEDRNSVTIVIRDSVSKQVISSGPFSSLKVQIVVLDGDFGADDKEDWTEEEFNANLVREREGKRPLVTGDLVITLRDGVGSVGDVSFTDNSSWIRSRKFRLGARPVQSASTEVRIREARSKAFVVKDHRGELYKKHHPPRLNDEIWRLDKIAKGGTYEKALAGNRITTVKDFLRSYYINPSFLRHVLVGISNKTWQTIIQHATACLPDDELYTYCKDGESIGIVFDSVYRVVLVTFDGGHSYQSLDMLNEFQTGMVENLKRHAFKNLNALVPFNAPPAIGPAMLAPSLLADPFSGSSSNLQDANFPGMHQDQMEMELASSQMTMTTSPPCSYNAQHTYGGPCDIGKSWAPVMQITHLTADDNSQVGTSIWQGEGFFFAPTDNGVGIAASNFGIPISRNGKPKARWCMIRAAVKWGISVRRDVAARRMARFLSQLS